MTGYFTPFSFRERENRPLLLTLGGISILLFTYTLVRAWTVVYTPDEVFSMWHFARKFTAYPDVYDSMTANHHWLNSWAMWLLRQLFGENEFASRLPNVLAHGVYLFFTARIALLLRRQFLFVLCAFLLLNAHPYLLDFFSLARGYGLAIGSMAASLFFALRFAGNGQGTRDLFYSLLAAALAMLSNFVLINYYLVLCALLLWLIWPGKKAEAGETINRLEQTLLLCVLSFALLAFTVPHLLRMQEANCLYYGAPGFWDGTVGSACTRLLYDAPYAGDNPFCSSKLTLQLLVLFGLVSAGWLIRKNGFQNWKRAPAGFSVLLLAGIITGMALQRLLLGTLYPQYRTGLFVFVIFMLVIVANLAAFPLRSPRPAKIAIALLTLPVVFHLLFCMNFVYVEEWKPSGGIDRFAGRIINDRARLPGPPGRIRISGDGTSMTTMIYLREKEKFFWLDIVAEWDAKKSFAPADYYLVEKAMRRFRDTKSWVAVDSCCRTGNILYVDPASPAGRTVVEKSKY